MKTVINAPPVPHSRLSYSRKLCVFFRWCVERGLRSDDPTDDVPRPKVPKKAPAFFKCAELAHLLSVMVVAGNERMADIARFTVVTGSRLSEISPLEFGDDDEQPGAFQDDRKANHQEQQGLYSAAGSAGTGGL